MTRLRDLLQEKKRAVLDHWFQLVLVSYPPETALFLKSQENRFANPVGYRISKSLEDLFSDLLNNGPGDTISPFLDNIIQVRALQDFMPSQAVAFIFGLKGVIRDELKGDLKEKALFHELSDLESRIDRLGLLAFDTYVKCIEKTYNIRVTELRNKTYLLLRRAGLLHDFDNAEGEFADS